MSEPKVIVKNSSTSLLDYLVFGIFISWVMYVSGCNACKGTNSGTECLGKSAGETYKELKIGFDKGTI
jgi:hypothetical protein